MHIFSSLILHLTTISILSCLSSSCSSFVSTLPPHVTLPFYNCCLHPGGHHIPADNHLVDNHGADNSGGDNNGADNNGGDNNGSIQEYDPTKTYSTAGTIVTYQGKKYRNKWWVNPGDVPGNPNGPWELILENGEGTTADKALAYDIEATYPKAGTYVSYNGKIYTNKWFVSAGEYPGKDQWGPWELVTQ